MRPRGGSAVREVEFSIYKRLSQRWEELTKPLGRTELLTIWVDELDGRLNVDMFVPERLEGEGRREEALRVALKVLQAALEEAEKEVGKVRALSVRLHAPVCGSVPEEAGLFDASPERIRKIDPERLEKSPEEWFEKIWWHPWLLRLSKPRA